MRRLSALFIAILTILPLPAESFVVDRYSVSIDVDSARDMHFEEVMDLDFIYPSHGIIRDIQYEFPGYDGYPRTIAEVSNIRSSVKASVSRESGFVSVRMGDPSRLVSGKERFAISYDYAMGKDHYDEYDEVYINIVSADGWDTEMGEVSFRVAFPFPIDPGRVWVTYGRYGSLDRLPFNLSEDGRTITGVAYGLRPHEAITLRAEMDEGYFADAVDPYAKTYAFLAVGLAFSAVALLSVIFLYFRYGRDSKPIIVPQFHPPVGITPMDTAFITDGSVGDDAVGAMLLYWADKGYVRIDEKERGSYTFSVVMWPTDMDAREDALFHAFFSSPVVDGTALRVSGFPEKLRRSVIPEEARYFSGERALYDAGSVKARRSATVIAAILAICHALIGGMMTGFTLLVPCLILAFMAFASSRTLASAKRIVVPVIVFMAFFLFFIGFGFFTVLSSEIPASIALYETLSFVPVLFIVSIITHAVYKRSAYGDEVTAAIEGFREFIDKTEKDRIEKLSAEDPEYFYHVLSYAMVFGLADKWCAKFRGITVADASWYNPYEGVGDLMAYAYFTRAWRGMYRSSVAPQNGGPRGGGGGRPTFSGFSGHAGGGFSGGGGRSW